MSFDVLQKDAGVYQRTGRAYLADFGYQARSTVCAAADYGAAQVSAAAVDLPYC